MLSRVNFGVVLRNLTVVATRARWSPHPPSPGLTYSWSTHLAKSMRNGPTDQRPSSAADIFGCLSLVALALFVFLPTVGYGFVNWDDPWYVLDNPLITSWRPSNLIEIATKPAVRNYAPLTMFGYLIEHSLWGTWAGGYHLVNVLLHAVNAVLVYVLLRQLTSSRFISWMTAALFAVHPVQVETVAWISSFKGVLSATFILASLICWLRPRPSPRNDAWAVVFHALGLLAKAVAITLPAVVFCYDVLVAGKRVADAAARQIVPCLLAGLVLLVTMSAQTSVLGGVRDHLHWSKARVAAFDTVVLWDYVGLLVWPHDLCVLYDPPTTGIAGAIALASVGWLAVAAGAWTLRRQFPLFVVGLVAFAALLFPVLNFFPITTLMNDRYLYLPSIPVFALMAAGLERIYVAGRVQVSRFATIAGAADDLDRPSERRPVRVLARSLAAAACGVLLCGYLTATHDRLPVWRNDQSLWADAVAKSASLPVVRIQWAQSLYAAHHPGEALAVLHRTLVETRPDEADRERIQTTITNWSGASVN
jgi:protein O-mannosyl-transferase